MEGFYTRNELDKIGFKSIGSDVLISKKVSIYLPGRMNIGSHVRIDDFCFLVGEITLGNYIHLAPFCSIHGTGGGTVRLMDYCGVSGYSAIYAGSDDYGGDYMTNPMIDDEFKREIHSDIVLEKHAIIGLHCVLLPGAYLREGVAMGAMSLLNKDTKPWGIYVGIPAKRVKDRKKRILELEKEFVEKHR